MSVSRHITCRSRTRSGLVPLPTICRDLEVIQLDIIVRCHIDVVIIMNIQNMEQCTEINWNDIKWRHVDSNVKNLRCRIFKATRNKNWSLVRKLQKLMVSSFSNVLQATRRVTLISSGKGTAGVDQEVALSDAQRMDIAREIHNVDLHGWTPSPVRRIYLPKPDGRQRPIGIPTIRDRIVQGIILNALEPEWEAQFESCSYGFRPGKSYQDAVHRIHTLLGHKDRIWVVDADISGCFDNIDHSFLMERVKYFPYADLIGKWLKAGIMDQGVFKETELGTPQGGIISPLLCNIALHGMESELGIQYDDQGYVTKRANPLNRTFIRYADDFIILCPTKDIALKTIEDLRPILATRGLELSQAKTKVVCTLDGFDFLGFNIRHTLKRGWFRLRPLFIKSVAGIDKSLRKFVSTIVKPSTKSINNIKAKIRDIFKKHRGRAALLLIKKLNPVIRGYCESKRTWVFSQVARQLDNYVYKLTMGWIKRSHPKKSVDWVVRRYFRYYKRDFISSKWTFTCPATNLRCYKFAWFGTERFWPPVVSRNCPDDPLLRDYWLERAQKLVESRPINTFNKFELSLALSQKVVCPVCEQDLYSGEPIQQHHIIPRKEGGKDTFANMVLVHVHCHRHIHYGNLDSSEEQDWASVLTQFKLLHPRPGRHAIYGEELLSRVGRTNVDGSSQNLDSS